MVDTLVEKMTTADWAFIVSLVSLLTSIGGFVWNVWSKFIFPKAKVRSSIAVISVVDGGEISHRAISLSATNYGPGVVTLHTVVGRERKSWYWPYQHIIFNPLHNFPVHADHTIGPFSGGLPAKIDVGESFSSYLGLRHEGLRDLNIVDVGFVDSFGRNHWASRKSVRSVRKAVKKEFDK